MFYKIISVNSCGIAIFTLLLIYSGGCGDEATSAPPREDVLVDAGPADSSGKDDLTTPDSGPDAGPERCSTSAPMGECPAGRACQEGACIVQLNPGPPLEDPDQAFKVLEEIWTFYDESYGAFPAKTVDWDQIRLDYLARLPLVETISQLSWLMAQMVNEIGDGHTYLIDPARCGQDQNYGQFYSNVGACLTEVDGELLVYRTQEGSGFQPGDQVISIDGRSAEEALFDLELQPRCSISASTTAMKRSSLVDGLLLRAPTDKEAVIQRLNGHEVTVPLQHLPLTPSWLPCDGRVGLTQVTEAPYGIRHTILEGNILYITFPFFGGYSAQGEFVAQPMIDALREIFETAPLHAGLILDLRSNMGGAPLVYMALASWLFDEPTTLFTCRTRMGPDHADHGESWNMESIPDPTLHYGGPLAVLANPRTFSAGDFSTGFLSGTGRAKLFGAPSGGGFGNGGTVTGPEGWTLGFNDILCADLQGNLLEGHPPPVDFPVSYDPQDLAQGVDTVIEQARQWAVAQVP